MTKRTAPVRVLILAHDDMNLLDLTGPLQTLVTASRRHSQADRPLYDMTVASEAGGLVSTSAGMQVMTVPLSTLEEASFDTLIAPGGCKGAEYLVSPSLVEWVRRRAHEFRRICSVCTGAFLLAAAGQLDGRRVATHWEWAKRLKERHPALHIDPESIFIRDDSVWTSAGVTAGIDMTLALIEEDYGHQIAIDTARQLVVFMKRSGGQSQYSAPLSAQIAGGDKFAGLHAWVMSRLNEDLRVECLADHMGMSARTFARTYLAKTGRTPAKMVEDLRLEAACRALGETEMPLKRVAQLTGHVDEQNLRRTFLRRLGVNPSEYRQRFSAHASLYGAMAP